jgi:hypothetical protein
MFRDRNYSNNHDIYIAPPIPKPHGAYEDIIVVGWQFVGFLSSEEQKSYRLPQFRGFHQQVSNSARVKL